MLSLAVLAIFGAGAVVGAMAAKAVRQRKLERAGLAAPERGRA